MQGLQAGAFDERPAQGPEGALSQSASPGSASSWGENRTTVREPPTSSQIWAGCPESSRSLGTPFASS